MIPVPVEVEKNTKNAVGDDKMAVNYKDKYEELKDRFNELSDLL